MTISLQARLMSMAHVLPNGCWQWTGCIQGNGYGRVRSEKNTIYAHRAAHIAFKGPIPHGKDVCHTCDNRLCINPEHLFLGSRKENMQDARSKGRLFAGARHAKTIAGESGPAAKLNWAQVDAIRKALALGVSTKLAADIANVSIDTVRLIKNNKTWKEQYKCVA